MTRYKYDPAQGKVVEASKVWQEVPSKGYVIDDTMPMTRSPIDGRLYFESKSALRAHYKQHGMEEVGTSYEKGSDPWETEYKDREKETDRKIAEKLRYYGTRK